MNHSSSISEMNNQSSIKSKSMTDIVQQPLKKFQAGTGRISHQAIRRNGVAMGMHKFKQQEKWMPKQNASLRAEGNVGQRRHTNEVKERDPVGAVSASSVRREFGQATGNIVLKEAKDLKHIADRLKATGDTDHDIMRLYFEASLKFLHGASILEPFNDEIAKQGEIPQSLKLYIDTARLCKFCASTYERNKEMAAAALAYKCMGVAYMRVVLSKTFCLTRDWHELHAAFQNAPLGESLTLSSSYADNSNIQALMDKTFVKTIKVDGSPQVTAVAAQHRPCFLHVLEYTRDTIAGMEAFQKSEIAYSAAIVNVPDGNNGTEKMSAVKRVIDFSFHDIDGLLKLVRIALEAIYN